MGAGRRGSAIEVSLPGMTYFWKHSRLITYTQPLQDWVCHPGMGGGELTVTHLSLSSSYTQRRADGPGETLASVV